VQTLARELVIVLHAEFADNFPRGALAA